MKKIFYIRNLIFFATAVFFSSGIFAQNETIRFEYTKRCQYEVVIQNTSDAGYYSAYLWKVIIDGHIDESFTSPFVHPVFSFDDPSTDIQIRLIAYRKNNAGTDSLTKSLELITPPEISISGSNTVICSNEANVLFETKYLEGYEYVWTVSPDEYLDSKISDAPNRLVTNWKSVAATTEIEIMLTLTNTSTDDLCSYEMVKKVLLIPVSVPAIQDQQLVRKAPASNILLSLNGSNNSLLYRWGYSSTLIKTDTLAWCAYESIDPGTEYWAVIVDRTYSSCTSDTLKYHPDGSKNFDLNSGNGSQEPDVLLYPNPAHRHLTLEIPDADFNEALITVMDHTGRKIKTPAIETVSQNIFMVTFPDHLTGLFFFEIILDGNTRVIKKVIVR